VAVDEQASPTRAFAGELSAGAAAKPVFYPTRCTGKVVDGGVQIHETADGSRFATPALDLDKLVWPRTWPLPAAEVPVAEIIEVLAATGERLRDDPDGCWLAPLRA
jgi:hypothetical protein